MTAFVLGESDASVFVTPATLLNSSVKVPFILSQIQMLINQPQLTLDINKTNPPSFSWFSPSTMKVTSPSHNFNFVCY